MAKMMQDLFEILPGLLKTFPDSEEVREAVVFAVWNKAAGEVLQPHSVPVSLHKKHLTIAVRDKVWKRNLESMAPQLLHRVNRLLKSSEVKFVEFVIDDEKLEPLEARKNVENAVEDKSNSGFDTELVQKASLIDDESVRAVFLNAAKAYLLRKRRSD